jgi:hypothetical protein
MIPRRRLVGQGSRTRSRTLTDEIAESGLFRRASTRRYVWDVVYSADEYVGLLETYSSHRALDDETRARLLDRIHRRARERPNGQVRKTYLAILHVAEVQ